jgi:hypothetical protein
VGCRINQHKGKLKDRPKVGSEGLRAYTVGASSIGRLAVVSLSMVLHLHQHLHLLRGKGKEGLHHQQQVLEVVKVVGGLLVLLYQLMSYRT